MARCYSQRVPRRQTSFPRLWLVSDARNDAVLERVLARLPRGSGLIFRHYHLAPTQRRARFDALARNARRRGHMVVLAGDARTARAWGADGAYGPPRKLARGPALLRLVTAHSLGELGRTGRADMALLSPVFATRSHVGGRRLGAIRFHLIARRALCPVAALGGVDRRRAHGYKLACWAAIDGLCGQSKARNP